MCYSWYCGRVYETGAFVHGLRFGAGNNRAGVYARHWPYEPFVAVQGNDAAGQRAVHRLHGIKKDHWISPVVFCYMHRSGYASGMCSNGAQRTGWVWREIIYMAVGQQQIRRGR